MMSAPIIDLTESDYTTTVLLDNEGICKCCSTQIKEDDNIQCTECKRLFHAICPSSKIKICTKTLLNLFMNKSTRDNFFWLCVPCLITYQMAKTKKDDKRIDNLEKEFTKIDSQLQEIKSIVAKTAVPVLSPEATTVPSLVSPRQVPKPSNPWKNTTRIEIMKDNLGHKPDLSILEGTECFSSSVSHIVSHDTRDGRTILTCSNDIADRLREEVNTALPDHEVQLKKPVKSIIKVVGFKNELENSMFTDYLFARNDSLSEYNNDEHYELLKVKQCLKSPTTFQAVLKVSGKLRSAIRKLHDRLIIGYHSCRIYDQVSTMRCNKCQHFGHFKRDCSNEASCAVCAGNHLTESCSASPSSVDDIKKCINCVRSGITDHNHKADSPFCSAYLNEHEKCRKLFLNNLN